MITHRVWFGIAGFLLAAVAVVAFVASGNAIHGGTPKQRLSAWVTQTGLGENIGTLRGDGRSLGKVLASHGNIGAIHTVCGVLTTDAESANSHLPAPDATVTRLLAAAFAKDFDAGSYCYKAGTSNHALLATAERDLTAATGLFEQVLVRVSSVTTKTVPTTTTTGPSTGTSFF